jgi:hypothetical protein
MNPIKGSLLDSILPRKERRKLNTNDLHELRDKLNELLIYWQENDRGYSVDYAAGITDCLAIIDIFINEKENRK